MSSLPTGLSFEMKQNYERFDEPRKLYSALIENPNDLVEFVKCALEETPKWLENNKRPIIASMTLLAKNHDPLIGKIQFVSHLLQDEKLRVIYLCRGLIEIDELSGFNPDQVCEAIELSRLIGNAFESELSSFPPKEETLYLLFSVAQKIRSESIMNHCLEFIREKTKLKVQFGNDFQTFEVSANHLDNYGDIKKYLSFICEKGEVTINLEPDRTTLPANFEDFHTQFGDRVAILDLRQVGRQIDNQILKLIIKNCPNTSHLFLQSRKLTKDFTGLGLLKNLETVNLSGCDSIEKLPDLAELVNLRLLNLSGCQLISEIPGLAELRNLVMLNLSDCQSIKEIPNLDKLRNLELLNLSGCRLIGEIPELAELVNLKLLNLSGCPLIEEIPELAKLVNLTLLNLSGCTLIEKIPELAELKNLTVLNLSGCQRIKRIPELTELRNLEELKLAGCQLIEEIPSLDKVVNLEVLNLTSCHLLKEIPRLDELRNLRVLNLTRCQSLEKLPDLAPLINLKILTLKGCHQIDVEQRAEVFFSIVSKSLEQAKKLELFSETEAFFEIPDLLIGLQHRDEFKTILNFLLTNVSPHLKLFAIYLFAITPQGQINQIKEILHSHPSDYELIIARVWECTSLPEWKETLAAPSLMQYRIFKLLNLPLPESLNYNPLIEAGFKGSDAILLELISTDLNFRNAIEDFLKTENGKKCAIENRNRLHDKYPEIVGFIKKLYPLDEAENFKFYPFKIVQKNEKKLKIHCTRHHAKGETELVFRRLSESLKKRNISRLEVTYLEETGVDDGGLRRHFLHSLADSLSSQFELQKAIKPISGVNHELFIALGRFLKFLIRAKGYYQIGEILHPDYFKGFLRLTYEETASDLENISDERIEEIITGFTQIVTSDSYQKLQSLLSWDGSDPESHQDLLSYIKETYTYVFDEELPSNESLIDFETLLTIKARMRSAFIDSNRGIVYCLHSIAKGFDCDRKEWKAFQSFGAETLQLQIQGFFTKEAFFKKIKFIRVSPEIVKWVTEWIENKSDEELKRFAAFIGGAPVVPSRKIKIVQSEEISHVEVHSCSLEIDIPKECDEEGLKLVLDSYCLEDEGKFSIV